MAYRLVVLASATAVVSLLACGGANAGVSSLPSSEKVSDGPDTFCSDVTRYFTNIESSLIPYYCALAVENAPSGDCQATYAACVAGGDAYLQSDGNAQALNSIAAGCSSAVAECGATVGVVSTCIADFASELESLSRGVTAASACSGTANLRNVTIPASCTSLPSGCNFGSSTSVSVSGG